MNGLRPGDFGQFFRALHEREPFPWQSRLAARVCAKGWPSVIDLPTASGKTACIDIALFALAATERAPRRIFFIVDRRLVVNDAYQRARRIAQRIGQGEGVLDKVAQRFRELAGRDETELLGVTELRGGIYRDHSWVRNPMKPMVVLSTVDQVGSRLLFRGYGVSQKTLPIHAGLIANDALLILDEAHCSRAFAQTLESIEEYRSERWAQQALKTPFAFVEMSATPSLQKGTTPFRITDQDRAAEQLRPRIFARKTTRLLEVKARTPDALADSLAREVLKLAAEAGEIRGAAVIVNRVATARKVWQRLKAAGRKVELVIGRMRPIDRDDQLPRLQVVKAGAPRPVGAEPLFVVTTQCIEVGADLDFDVLVTECASIDALLQRFGRLDRLGGFGRALGSIVITSGHTAPKKPDAVYGEALSATWRWLTSIAAPDGRINMGIEAAVGEGLTVAQHLNSLSRAEADVLRRIGLDAPALQPAHVDAFAQTSPQPHPDPDPAIFLHGPEPGAPDVQVVWRCDLGKEPGRWCEIVALCPPIAAECMSAPIGEVKRWLRRETPNPDASDLESATETDTTRSRAKGRLLVVLQRKSSSVGDAEEVRPGDTVVVPADYGGWDEVGFKPSEAEEDLADRAYVEARRKMRLRLHPTTISRWPETPSGGRMKRLIESCGEELGVDTVREELQRYRKELEEAGVPERSLWLLRALGGLDQRLVLTPYPSANGTRPDGWIVEGKRRPCGEPPIYLDRHTEDVVQAVHMIASHLLPALVKTYVWAAGEHDGGKSDIRFQGILRGGDLIAARLAPKLLAKGASANAGQGRCGLPRGFRHELLSVQLTSGAFVAEDVDRDLALHLIASHHGCCRPFAPVIVDGEPESVSFGGYTLDAQGRTATAAHRLDSGVPERFWVLIRRYGWWGLAYLEALFRLGDWMASDEESEGA